MKTLTTPNESLSIHFDADKHAKLLSKLGKLFQRGNFSLFQVLNGDGTLISEWNTEEEAREFVERYRDSQSSQDNRIRKMTDLIIQILQLYGDNNSNEHADTIRRIAMILSKRQSPSQS